MKKITLLAVALATAIYAKPLDIDTAIKKIEQANLKRLRAPKAIKFVLLENTDLKTGELLVKSLIASQNSSKPILYVSKKELDEDIRYALTKKEDNSTTYYSNALQNEISLNIGGVNYANVFKSH